MDLKLLTQEQLDTLVKTAKDHEEILLKQKQAETDAIRKSELDKATADLMAKIDVKEKELTEKLAKLSVVPEPPKVKFGKTKEDSTGMSFEDFMFSVKCNDPKIAHLKTAMSTSSGAVGGYLVPVEYLTTIEGKLSEIAQIQPLCTTALMKAPTAKLPKMLTNATVYWSTQANAKTESSFTFDQDTLTLNYLYCMIKETNELRNDEIVQLSGWLETEVADLMNTEEEAQILAGSGSPFTGVTAATGINSALQLGGNLDYTDFVNCLNNTGQLERYRIRSNWVFSRTVMGLAMNIVDSVKRPIWNLNTALGDKMVSTILGYPYKITPNIASTKIVFGDFSRVIIGEKENERGLKVAFTDSATIGSDNLFEKNMVGFRFERRTAILVGWAPAFTVITGVK